MNLVKTILQFDDGSQQEFNAAPVVPTTLTVDSLMAALQSAVQTTVGTQVATDQAALVAANTAAANTANTASQ